MIGRNGTNRAKEKLVHNVCHRISRNHNLEGFTREKGYYLKDLQGFSFENVDWIFLSK